MNWQPIETAPKDGTRIILGWKEPTDTEMQEYFGPMSWSDTTRNSLVSSKPGMWVMVDAGEMPIYTWHDGEHGPTHWAEITPPPTQSSDVGSPADQA